MDTTRDMTTAEVMHRLNVAKRTVYALAAAGRLKGYRLGRDRRYTAESVDALRGVEAPPPAPAVVEAEPEQRPRRRRQALPEWLVGVRPVIIRR